MTWLSQTCKQMTTKRGTPQNEEKCNLTTKSIHRAKRIIEMEEDLESENGSFL